MHFARCALWTEVLRCIPTYLQTSPAMKLFNLFLLEFFVVATGIFTSYSLPKILIAHRLWVIAIVLDVDATSEIRTEPHDKVEYELHMKCNLTTDFPCASHEHVPANGLWLCTAFQQLIMTWKSLSQPIGRFPLVYGCFRSSIFYTMHAKAWILNRVPHVLLDCSWTVLR